MTGRGVAIALSALTLAALLFSHADPAQGRTRIGFWAGEAVLGADSTKPGTYWNRRDTRPFKRKVWRALAANRIPLYLNLRYRRDFGPVPAGKPQWNDGLAIVRKANQLGVPVWGWILVPYDKGYWAWEGAAVEHLRAVKALWHWTRVKGVHLRGIALDPEPPIDMPFEAKASILAGGVDPVFTSLLQQTVNPERQCAAIRGYRRILNWATREHVELTAAPAATALDDIEDGSLALQDAGQFVLPNGRWHRLFFQAYRSTFSYYGSRKAGSGLISSYLRSARRHYGQRGQISIGSAGRRSYEHLGSLVHDVRLAATLGARELPIYSLERTLRAYGGARAINRLVWASHHPFKGKKGATATAASPNAEAIRSTIRLTDTTASNATPQISEGLGHARPANPWPGGCQRAEKPKHGGGKGRGPKG